MLSIPKNCPEPLGPFIQKMDYSTMGDFAIGASRIYPFQIINVWHQLQALHEKGLIRQHGNRLRVLSIGAGGSLEVAAIAAFCQQHNMAAEIVLVDNRPHIIGNINAIYKRYKGVHTVCCDAGDPDAMQKAGVQGTFDLVFFRHPPIYALEHERRFCRNALIKTIPRFTHEQGLVLMSFYFDFEMALSVSIYQTPDLKDELAGKVNLPTHTLARVHETCLPSPDPKIIIPPLYPESHNLAFVFSDQTWKNRLGYLIRIAVAKGDYASCNHLRDLNPLCLQSLLSYVDADVVNSSGSGTKKTALHWACCFRENVNVDVCFKMIRALLAHGADPLLKDVDGRENGKTALDYFHEKAPKAHREYREVEALLMRTHESQNAVKSSMK